MPRGEDDGLGCFCKNGQRLPEISDIRATSGCTTFRIVYLYVVQVPMYLLHMHVHVGQQIPSQAQDLGVDVSGA